MKYSPSWLRWTGVGKLLADADWNMKCLHVGVRTNEDKTIFKSWPLSSNLEGLATHLDFPQTSIGPVVMTCEHVTTSEEDDELVFTEEPKMKITDYSNPLYSKYITEHYPAVAYYDEPVFLKMQELMKLIVAVEWFHKKGVKANQEWIMSHTSKFKREVELNNAKKPPFEMIPQPSSYERPSKDVTVNTYNSSCNKAIAKHAEQFYGYVDFDGAEVKAFKADGTEVPPIKCLKIFIEDKLEFHEARIGWVYVPLPPSMTVGDYITDNKEKIIKVWEERQTNGSEKKALLSKNHQVEDLSVKEDEIKIRFTDTLDLYSSSNFAIKRTLTLTATVDNYGVFPEEYLKMPALGSEGLIVPDVESWNELIHDLSVPIPAFWQNSIDGIGEPTATGGVSTSSFEHRQVPHSTPGSSRVSQPTKSSKRVSGATSSFAGGSRDTTSHESIPKIVKHGAYRSNGQVLSVSTSAVSIEDISRKFFESWIGGNRSTLKIERVLQINNKPLEKAWSDYKKANPQQEHMLYHGTSACEMITTKGQFCGSLKCGICGISNNGMSLEFAGNSFPEFQRFGKGIYLAPNSSKANDYTEENGKGYRAMLYCDVLLGRQHIIKDGDSEDIKGPSPYFNSIVVKPGKHRVPEVVVFDERVVLPRYIIVYKSRKRTVMFFAH